MLVRGLMYECRLQAVDYRLLTTSRRLQTVKTDDVVIALLLDRKFL